ncbi:hypothetical protein TNCV_4285281 [Trichonephila clavipes]|nr:hypothetical protein TNCV_4285281 [Trichonephila clavipes]
MLNIIVAFGGIDISMLPIKLLYTEMGREDQKYGATLVPAQAISRVPNHDLEDSPQQAQHGDFTHNNPSG